MAGDPSAMLVLPTGHIVILPRAGKKFSAVVVVMCVFVNGEG